LTATAELASAARIPALVELMAEFYAASGYPLDRLWATNSFSVLLNDPSWDRLGCCSMTARPLAMQF